MPTCGMSFSGPDHKVFPAVARSWAQPRVSRQGRVGIASSAGKLGHPAAPPALTSSSAMMRSSSSSSLMADAMMGGVDAGLTTSDTVRLSFTWGFWVSSSSDSAFCKRGAGR